ncbi:hypothetical protein [Arthrobacter sp. Alg241-R88]|nr:hypothetical protein [Arthrobacter sp. Alg241-R88]
MTDVIRKHGRRRGPGPAQGGGKQLAILGTVVLLIVLAVAALALTR